MEKIELRRAQAVNHYLWAQNISDTSQPQKKVISQLEKGAESYRIAFEYQTDSERKRLNRATFYDNAHDVVTLYAWMESLRHTVDSFSNRNSWTSADTAIAVVLQAAVESLELYKNSNPAIFDELPDSRIDEIDRKIENGRSKENLAAIFESAKSMLEKRIEQLKNKIVQSKG